MEFVDKKVTRELIEVGDLVKVHNGSISDSLRIVGYDDSTEKFLTINLNGYVRGHYNNSNDINDSATLVTKGKDLILTVKEK